MGGLEGNEPEAQAATQGPTQNRVCVTCRRRKVKCDKRQPCQNCVKLRTECVFPSKRCAADRQAAADAELLHELRRLEPLFQSLVSKINDDGAAGLSLPPPPPPVETTSQPQPTGTSESPAVSSIIPSPPQLPAASPMVLELPSLHGSPFTTNSLCGSDTVPWSPYGTTVGKLVKDLGKNRYISGLFWDALHMEVRCSSSLFIEPFVESPTEANGRRTFELTHGNYRTMTACPTPSLMFPTILITDTRHSTTWLLAIASTVKIQQLEASLRHHIRPSITVFVHGNCSKRMFTLWSRSCTCQLSSQ